MRILWVKIGGLWPPNTGGRLRSFHVLKELSKRHNVTLLTTHVLAEETQVLRSQLPQCKCVESVPYVPLKWHSLRFLLMLIRSWFSPMPVELLKHKLPELQRQVAYLLSQRNYDLCIADFLVVAPNLPFGGATPVVYFAHNVEHMIWKRLCEMAPAWWQRPLLALEWRKMRRAELRICRAADLTVTVSAVDLELLKLHAPDIRGCSIATGVDTAYFTPTAAPEMPTHLVFSGSMDWHPNEDAMLHFMTEILPAIRHGMPTVTATVVGRNPSKRLQMAAAHNGVQLTGTVNDVRPYVCAAAVYVVPLRVGGGTRLKIFEALAMGMAVVSTSIGAEGLPLLDNVHYVRADTPAEFAESVLALLRDPDRRKRLGEAGRRLVEEQYGWPNVAHEFEEQCVDLLTTRGMTEVSEQRMVAA